MNHILEELSTLGIVPIIELDQPEDASPLAGALCNGGLPCAEVTFRTDAAEESIRIMSTQFPDMLVGAGTVLTTSQVDCAIAAGARFIVSPGLNPKIVRYCLDQNIPIIPGCTSPGEIEQAIELGLDVVKFFPAEASGGLTMIKALSGPYRNIRFMPTGGIQADTVNTYLGFSKVIACGGSWMVNKEFIKNKNFTAITALTKDAVSTILNFEVVRIGINEANASQAASLAAVFEKMFGFIMTENKDSIFAGDKIEIMKTPCPAANGQITVGTNYINRAVYHLGKRGFEFDPDTAEYDKLHNLNFICLKGEFGGFRLVLKQK